MLVSIIVPSFNQGRFIRETLDSILGQNHRPLEVLVMDGGSTDTTRGVLESYSSARELRWWSEPDRGVVDAVNKGLARARGEIIGIQSSDDTYLPSAVSTAVGAFEKNEKLSLAYGDVQYMDEDSKITGAENQPPFDLALYLGRFLYVPQPAAFFRATVLDEIGGWREHVSYAADADFWMRIAVNHQVRKLDCMMGRYRYHAEQRDRQRARIASDWERAVSELLAGQLLTRRERRWAKMGLALARHRYAPAESGRERTLALCRAVITNPIAVADPRFPRRELLPSRAGIKRVLAVLSASALRRRRAPRAPSKKEA